MIVPSRLICRDVADYRARRTQRSRGATTQVKNGSKGIASVSNKPGRCRERASSSIASSGRRCGVRTAGQPWLRSPMIAAQKDEPAHASREPREVPAAQRKRLGSDRERGVVIAAHIEGGKVPLKCVGGMPGGTQQSCRFVRS